MQEAHETLKRARDDAAAHQTAALQRHAEELAGLRLQRDGEATVLRQEADAARDAMHAAEAAAHEARGGTKAVQTELAQCKEAMDASRAEVRTTLF